MQPLRSTDLLCLRRPGMRSPLYASSLLTFKNSSFEFLLESGRHEIYLIWPYIMVGEL